MVTQYHLSALQSSQTLNQESIRLVVLKMNGREICIPVSFGHIAAVEWGNPDGEPIIALHGWQDNALTFQPLAQHLPPNLHIVAIDFSGHGLSSHLGPGANYNSFHYACDVLRTVKYLKWESFSILAHSMGAVIASKFIALFPSKVKNLITIDVLYPSASIKEFDQLKSVDFVELFLKLDDREAFSPFQKVSWEEAMSQFGVMRTNLSKDNLALLLRRSVRPVGEGGTQQFVFTRDHRTKIANQLEYTRTSVQATMSEIHNYTGTWLAIMNDKSWYTPNAHKIDENFKETYTRNCKWFRVIHMKDVNSHFFHMDFPERVAAHVREVFVSNDN